MTLLLSVGVGAAAQEAETAQPLPATAPAAEESTVPDAPVAQGPVFTVSGVRLTYATEQRGQIPLEEIAQQTVVELTPTPSGFTAPQPDQPTQGLLLSRIGADGPVQMHVSAIRQISEQIVRTLNRRGVGGVFVFPDPVQFDAQLNDLRDDQQLDMIVSLESVASVKTTATGERYAGREAVTDLPQHRRIVQRSPVQVDDLLLINALDEYALRLNRHPARRVDVSVTAAADDAGVPGTELEYLVYESRPWRVYGQVSNTGTEATNDWRTQFGYTNYQLTNNDDIFSIDYITAGFDASNAIITSYEAPLGNSERWRWLVSGSFSDYTASELGPFQDDFSGTTWTVRGQVAWNFFQSGPLFLDAVGGFEWQNLEVDNELALRPEAEVNLYLLDAGLRLQRLGEIAGWEGSVAVNWLVGDDASASELTTLGRTAPDDDWATLRWGATGFWYLEPLLNRERWEDPTSRWATLAHELSASFRGQYAFDRRLIPQHQQTAGGFYTVRGYPESASVGDSVVIGSLEYRFHLPRSFRPEPEPGTFPVTGTPFRYSPDQPYGAADWDLIFRAFIDVGRTMYSDPLPFEEDQTLVGTGVGLELLLKRNLSLRADWGVALNDLDAGDEQVDAGDNRFHLVFTLLY